MKCWWCGIEPDGFYRAMSQETGENIRIVQWPDGDHEHSDRPPTPAQLEESGHLAMMRMLREMVE